MTTYDASSSYCCQEYILASGVFVHCGAASLPLQSTPAETYHLVFAWRCAPSLDDREAHRSFEASSSVLLAGTSNLLPSSAFVELSIAAIPRPSRGVRTTKQQRHPRSRCAFSFFSILRPPSPSLRSLVDQLQSSSRAARKTRCWTSEDWRSDLLGCGVSQQRSLEAYEWFLGAC